MGSAETGLALKLTARQASDFELLANGGFVPLRGFMGADDWRSSCESMRLTTGEYWPIPITLATDLECGPGDVVELAAPNGKALGRLTVSEVFERELEVEAENVYRTTDQDHPGVAAIYREGTRCVAGEIDADALPDHDEAFMRRYQTPAEAKASFEERGWKRIVAFQTRNPIHRAHEYLTKAALEICDGLYIQPLFFEHTFWCHDCEGMGSAKTCPHPQESHLFLSGTKVREMLENGEKPPHEFSRDEVAEILIDAYRKESATNG